MKKWLLTFLIPAWAIAGGNNDPGTESHSESSSSSYSNSISTAGDASATATSGDNISQGGDATNGGISVRTERSAPGLGSIYAQSTAACLKVYGGGISVLHGGVNLGIPITDRSCRRLAEASGLQAMGAYRAAASKICKDPDIDAAYEDSNLNCITAVHAEMVRAVTEQEKKPDPEVRVPLAQTTEIDALKSRLAQAEADLAEAIASMRKATRARPDTRYDDLQRRVAQIDRVEYP